MIEISINHQEFKFTITFAALRRLRYVNEKLYVNFFDCYSAEIKDIAEKSVLIYTAYVCANFDNPNMLSENEFYSLLEDDLSVVDVIYYKIYYTKINNDFAKAFIKRTRKYDTKIVLPKFTLADLEDYYCYFVLLNKIPEETFWNCEIPFIEAVTVNKNAVDGFMNYQQHKLLSKK